MGLEIVSLAARHDGQVGRGLRAIVERDGLGVADVVVRAEGAAQDLAYSADHGRMATPLGLADDQPPIEELDRLVLVEEALLDEPVVFGPGEAAGLGAVWTSTSPS